MLRALGKIEMQFEAAAWKGGSSSHSLSVGLDFGVCVARSTIDHSVGDNWLGLFQGTKGCIKRKVTRCGPVIP